MTSSMNSSTPKKNNLAAFLVGMAGVLLTCGLLWLMAKDLPQPQMLFGHFRLREVALAMLLLIVALGIAFRLAGRQALFGYLACLLPVVLLVVLLEGLGRAGLVDWEGLFTASAASEESAPGWSLEPDLVVTGETRQDIAVRYGLENEPIPFDFRTDKYGFRNLPGEEEGEMIILGDSIVVGAAVAVEKTVAEVVQTEIGRPVMQAALLGTAIQRQHEFLRASGLSLQGKTVIQFLFEGNDLLDSAAYRAAPPVAAAGGTGRGKSSFLRFVWGRLVPLTNSDAPYYSCDIAGQTYGFLWTRRSFEGVEGELANITNAIEDFRSQLEAEGARYALVFVPTKYRVLHPLCDFPEESQISVPEAHLSTLPKELDLWSKSQSLPLLDLTGPLKSAADSGQVPWFWGDTHWNAEGHAVAGQAVSGWIEQGLR